MVTQTWTYQAKNSEERIGKEKKVQVRNEYIENTEKCKLLIIHRRARREEERTSFLLL
jgi:basic membrane lipoprotein Med (substrate-binding protein (PBP1-ABC) superfamily)